MFSVEELNRVALLSPDPAPQRGQEERLAKDCKRR